MWVLHQNGVVFCKNIFAVDLFNPFRVRGYFIYSPRVLPGLFTFKPFGLIDFNYYYPVNLRKPINPSQDSVILVPFQLPAA
jgi:hypothetical protein